MQLLESETFKPVSWSLNGDFSVPQTAISQTLRLVTSAWKNDYCIFSSLINKQIICIIIIKCEYPTATTNEIHLRDVIWALRRVISMATRLYGQQLHYNDVTPSATASQITSLTIVYSTAYSRRRSKKTSKVQVTGLCDGNSHSPHKGPVTRKMFPFDDVIMYSG